MLSGLSVGTACGMHDAPYRICNIIIVAVFPMLVIRKKQLPDDARGSVERRINAKE